VPDLPGTFTSQRFKKYLAGKSIVNQHINNVFKYSNAVLTNKNQAPTPSCFRKEAVWRRSLISQV
jgi:hypothetical protein